VNSKVTNTSANLFSHWQTVSNITDDGVSYVKTKASVNAGEPATATYEFSSFGGVTHCNEGIINISSFTPSIIVIVTLGTITNQSIGVAHFHWF